MKILYKLLSFVIIVCAFSANENLKAQTTTSLNSTVRAKTDLLIGFNRRSDKGTWWTDASFKTLVAEMNPDIVRYPAGTQANYWDWSTGKFLDNTDKSWNNKEVLKIPEFVAALPSRTNIVYVVNMARPTPATGVSVIASEEILKSDATLNLKIADMLTAIAKFVEQGAKPYAIELGNEFFFGNEESGIFHIVEDQVSGKFYSGWDTANSQPYETANKREATVINAKFYLKQCKTIVAAIRAVYPTMKFALTTTKEEPNAASRERWNTTIFNELENNTDFATLKSDIYAVTQHHYLNDKYGVQTVISDNATAKVAIAEGIQYPIDKQSDYDLVPDDYKIWYTEYGEVKEIAVETWASAVRYAALVHSWITRGDKVGQLDFHYISDNDVINTDNPIMKLAPVGIAAKLVSKATAEMTEMQEINFSANPISVNGVKSLYGYKFKNNDKETLLIINTSDSDFPTVQFNNLITYTGQPTVMQYYSSAPYVGSVYEGHSNIVSSTSNVNTSFAVNKFSISVVEIENSTLGVETINLNNVSMYPNPVKDVITLKSNNQIQSVSIWSANGTQVYIKNNLNSHKIDLSNITTGIYLMKITFEKGVTFKKIIKI